MFEKYIRILIICSCLFGLLGILLITYFYDSRQVLVSSLLDLKPNEKIYVVSGQVKDIKEKSNTLFFQLCDSYVCLPCVYFNPTDKDIQFVSRNQEIKVKARYTTFNNSPELIVFSFLWVIL